MDQDERRTLREAEKWKFMGCAWIDMKREQDSFSFSGVGLEVRAVTVDAGHQPPDIADPIAVVDLGRTFPLDLHGEELDVVDPRLLEHVPHPIGDRKARPLEKITRLLSFLAHDDSSGVHEPAAIKAVRFHAEQRPRGEARAVELLP